MAGNLPVPQGVECKLVWTYLGVPHALNILHFRNPSNAIITQSVAEAIDVAVKASASTMGHMTAIHTGVALARVETRSMAANSDPWFIGTGAAVSGSASGHPLPAATSFVVTLTTGLRGRSYNGRIYLWGYTEDANDAAGGITAAMGNNSRLFIQDVMNDLAGATPSLQLAVLSRYTTLPGTSIPVERNPPTLTNVNAVLTKDLRWDVQRRRAVPGV